MAFCTKCGRPLADGEVCDCQKQTTAQVIPQEQTFDPYQGVDSDQVYQESGEKPIESPAFQENVQSVQPQEPAQTIVSDKDNIAINIDKEKMKQNLSEAADKIQFGMAKGMEKINDSREKAESSSVYESGMKIVPECVSANDGEIPIKQYNFAKLRTRAFFEKSFGRLQITNKRVIFRATGRSLFGKNVIQQEFRLDQIAGVEVRCKKEFNLFNLIMGIIITGLFGGLAYLIGNQMDDVPSSLVVILSVVVLAVCGALTYFHKTGVLNEGLFSLRQILLGFATGSYIVLIEFDTNGFIYFCAGFMVIACLINLFLMSIVQNLVMVFKTGAAAAIEIKREPMFGLLQFLFSQRDDQNSGFREIIPWTDTDIAIREVGTIIDDIKTMGDAAIEKWKQD